jgi:hypothetical protein
MANWGALDMFTAQTFRLTVIDPTLKKLGLYSEAASDLLLGTAIQESGGFRWNKQLGGGPARGYFQMEKNTHDDIWENYLAYRKSLSELVKHTLSADDKADVETLVSNSNYAAAMTRIHYKRAPAAIPNAGDIEAMAKYWKKYYNGSGKGTPDEFIKNWEKYAK